VVEELLIVVTFVGAFVVLSVIVVNVTFAYFVVVVVDSLLMLMVDAIVVVDLVVEPAGVVDYESKQPFAFVVAVDESTWSIDDSAEILLLLASL
jgi:hypothetical protein